MRRYFVRFEYATGIIHTGIIHKIDWTIIELDPTLYGQIQRADNVSRDGLLLALSNKGYSDVTDILSLNAL